MMLLSYLLAEYMRFASQSANVRSKWVSLEARNVSSPKATSDQRINEYTHALVSNRLPRTVRTGLFYRPKCGDRLATRTQIVCIKPRSQRAERTAKSGAVSLLPVLEG
jgi:hypothetical protein